MAVLEEKISGDGNDQWSRDLDSCMSLTFDGTVNRSVHNIAADTNGLSVDDMALLLVDLMEEQCSGDVPEYLPSREASPQLFSPNESTEGNITIEESRVVIESPPVEHIGMGLGWLLTYPAETSHQLRTLFYQKGCPFVPLLKKLIYSP